MAKLTGPDFIALQVTDMERSKSFYTRHLGLLPTPHSPPDAVVFDTRPIPFAIRKPMVDLAATDRLGWGVVLWIASDDAEGLHAHLAAEGIPIVKPPADGPFGRFFSFSDPDGYTITVHQAARVQQPVTLDPEAGRYVLINTFEVDPDRADELLEVLSRATDETMRDRPGFISANLHLSDDRKNIANYAQWKDKETYEAMRNDPAAQVHMREAMSIAKSFSPLFYELRESHVAHAA